MFADKLWGDYKFHLVILLCCVLSFALIASRSICKKGRTSITGSPFPNARSRMGGKDERPSRPDPRIQEIKNVSS